MPDVGPLTVDVAYGGNFYGIIEPQGAYAGLDALGAARILQLSPLIRSLVREIGRLGGDISGFVHPAVQQAMRQRWHKKSPETEGDHHA